MSNEFKQLEQKLNELEDTYDNIYYSFFDHSQDSFDPSKLDSLLKDCKSVDCYGGTNKGFEYWTIWFFPVLNIYVRFEGEYSSDDGPEFNRMIQVFPKEIKKIEFVPPYDS